ncbi:MAG TPA: pyridoxamine 5'-phosphate oxidase family protein [Nitrososphaera sp.]|nr:pyridoxamine 5'-phosphate oxidase family protein [Nitrososphaera sp.]
MAQIDEDVIRLIIKQNHIVLVGSVSSNGIPNISPRYVLGILKNEKLLFADAFENKTFQNINAWPKVTAAVFDKDTQGGYQLKGEAEGITDPKLVAQAETKLKEFGIYEKPKKVWALTVKDVFSLEPSAKSRNPVSYFR